MTPRTTCLHRAADLESFRRAIAALVEDGQPLAVRDMFVVVPTRASAEELRLTLEQLAFASGASALCLPDVGTRADLLDALAARLAPLPERLTDVDREVLLARAARAAATHGLAAPFAVRPGLIAEMLRLYDALRRQLRSVERFETLLVEELEGSDDRGAVRMLAQSRFLAEAFRGYEAGVQSSGRLDEHRLRDRLVAEAAVRPLRHVVVTVADRAADPAGLWPSDLDLLARLPGLLRLDVIATEAQLSAGWLERVHHELPGLDERVVTVPDAPRPVCLVPSADTWTFVSRDREEELAGVVRRLKAEARAGRLAPEARVALVVARPLPYLYLAREVLERAGVPFDSRESLPLAAEPFAAALDLVFEWVTGGFTRAATIALLRSPHFRIAVDGVVPDGAAVDALDRALADARYLGDLPRLVALVETWSALPDRRRHADARRALPAARAAAAAAARLAPLLDSRPVTEHLATLDRFLDTGLTPLDPDDPSTDQHARVRAAVLDACRSLATAHAAFDPEVEVDWTVVVAAIRRWLGTQTFAARAGAGGVQIIDAATAPYGRFDQVHLLGLVDGEWPARERRSIFYPSFLLRSLGWPDDRQRLDGARAAFLDLLSLPRDRLSLSTISLDDEVLVEPSAFVHELPAMAPPRQVMAATPPRRVFPWEALALEPPEPDAVGDDTASTWARLRLARTPRSDPRFHGEAGAWLMPRLSVSRLERYLDCPFKFYSSEVLDLEEPAVDGDGPTPLERGLFLHELFERFFAAWQEAGHRALSIDTLPDAHALFDRLASDALSALPAGEAAIERQRLYGTAGAPGIARRVFAMEVERGGVVVERLLEFPLDGAFTFTAADGRTRTLTLRGKIDRLDLMADGTFHLIDYKTRTLPDPKRALQLPIYAVCAEQQLDGHRGRRWRLGQASYLSYEGADAVVGLTRTPAELPSRIAEAQSRLLDVLDDIAAGHFPPRPAERSLCTYCAYAAVCRKDYVGEPIEAPAAVAEAGDEGARVDG